MTKFNRIIQEKRHAKGDTLEQLAKALKISESFARHVVYSDSVPVSPRIVGLLAKRYRISQKLLESLAETRNKIGKRYYREYRKKNAA